MQGRGADAGARPGPAGQAVSFRADGRRLATIGPDGELRVWDIALSRPPSLLTRIRPRRRVVASAWNPAETNLLATLSAGGVLSVWRVGDDRPPQPVWTVATPTVHATTLAWLSDGRHLACGTAAGDISLWDIDWGVCRTVIAGRSEFCLAMSPTGGGLRIAFRDGLLCQLSVRTPGVAQLIGSVPAIAAAAWSAAGTRLAVAGDTGSIEVLDARLDVLCVADGTFGASPVLSWAEESVLVVADRTASTVAALDPAGRTLWRSAVPWPPGSLSVAGGMIALGGRRSAPFLLGLERGEPLT